eukprot:TRINITY_DN2732_c0_g1_i11.p1 TRINITY_DN2732_c0_g1~~TRINITY_DN2732_c0_g1_i11.p1  ORF type:complete len:111 (-),score=3.81 TRINITY_DN2732_c0_g1_i11:172-504(-)
MFGGPRAIADKIAGADKAMASKDTTDEYEPKPTLSAPSTSGSRSRASSALEVTSYEADVNTVAKPSTTTTTTTLSPSGSTTTAGQKFCGECGTKREGTAKFCISCGAKLP